MLCDSNVWLALALSKHVHHTAAREWLGTVEEPASVFFCRATQQAFLRLLTNASVLGPYGNPPLTNREAWSAYEAFLADDRIAFRGGRTGRSGTLCGRSSRCAGLPHPSSGWMPISPPSLWQVDIRW